MTSDRYGSASANRLIKQVSIATLDQKQQKFAIATQSSQCLTCDSPVCTFFLRETSHECQRQLEVRQRGLELWKLVSFAAQETAGCRRTRARTPLSPACGGDKLFHC
jgi:hypothetical protein